MQILNKDGKFESPKLEVPINKKRNYVLDGFLEILNPGRVSKGLPPLTYGRLNRILGHLDAWDKSIFLGSCKQAKNPAAYFWWALKPKKSVDK